MSEVRAQVNPLPQTPNRPAMHAKTTDQKGILLFSMAAGIIGGLCCLTPIVLVLLGLATVTAAADLGNLLYGEYRWAFRIAALALLSVGLFIYFRRRGICTLDQAKRQRNRIINVSLLILTAAIGIYLFWTYVVLHYWGIAAGLPWAEHSDEYWAIPGALIMFAAFALIYWRYRRSAAVETEASSESEEQFHKIFDKSNGGHE